MSDYSKLTRSDQDKNHHPFRRAVLRGLGVVLPSLLTIVFLLWMWNAVRTYVLHPAKDLAMSIAVANEWDVLPPKLPKGVDPNTDEISGVVWTHYDNKTYIRLASGEWLPQDIYDRVMSNPGVTMPQTAEAFYRRYFENRIFRPWLIIPLLLSLFILILYLLGKIIAARVGHALWTFVERVINRVPFISTVYSTVKQATDFFFADKEIEFNRVVAVQYPSRGLWSLGFVTGESLPDIRSAAAEPVLSVLMPTSPMPATGFTISVKKSETVELSISVDQAFQFIVSCGVVVPGVNQGRANEGEIQQHVEGAIAAKQAAAGNGAITDQPLGGTPPATDTTESAG